MRVTKSLLAVHVLLLVPVVHGCVVFQAEGGLNEDLWSQIWDSGTLTCMCTQMDGPGGLYLYHCLGANYAATFDQSSGVVQYSNPSGSFSFTSNFNQGWWTACNYGCTSEQCFLNGYFGG